MTTFNLTPMLEKMRSQDPDFRCMALIDFQKEVNKPSSIPFKLEEHTELTLFREVLKLVLEDEHTEVRNLATGCLGTLASIATRPASLTQTFDKLLVSSNSEEEEQSDIATLALKTMLLELRPSSQIAGDIVSKVVDGCTKQLDLVANSPPQHTIELLEILNLAFSRFHTQLSSRTQLQQSTMTTLLNLLTSARPHVRKRAVQGIVITAGMASNAVIRDVKTRLLANLSDANAKPDESMEVDERGNEQDSKIAYASLLASLMRSASTGKKFSNVLEKCLPGLLALTENVNDQNGEAVETGLTTLETLVLRSPTEITPFVIQITDRASELLKFDPNFVGGDDEDDQMDEEEEDQDEFDDDFDDQYSDDEDSSWKIRRAAARLLQAVLATRSELLAEFYKSVAPLLVSRLNDREESVRLEIFSAIEVLIKQTGVFKSQAKGASGNVAIGLLTLETPGLKRKRTDSMEVSSGKSLFPPLDQQMPNLTRAVLKQSLTKSIQTKEKSFQLLKAIVEVGEGGLDTQAEDVACSVQKAFASTAVTHTSTGSTTAASLAATLLAFLAAYFANHPVAVYADNLPLIVPCIVKTMSDKYQRTSIEAFNAASKLARGIRPNVSPSTVAPLTTSQVNVIKTIFDVTCQVLAGTSADSEVKEKATLTLGDLLVCEADALTQEVDQALPLLTARLGAEGTQLAALQVVGNVAESPICKGFVFENWLLTVLDTLPTLFKRSVRGVKPMALSTLNKVLARLGDKLPEKATATLVPVLQVFISPSDIANLPYALGVLSSLLKSPKTSAKASIEKDILPQVVSLIKFTSLQGSSLEALQEFIATYTSIDPDSATRLVPSIVKVFDVRQSISSISTTGEGSTAAYATAAKCIGVILKNTQDNFAGILSQFIRPVQVQAPDPNGQLYLSLLVLGEIGRDTDLSMHGEVFDNVLALFGSPDEQIKTAAAFAAGNIAVGNTNKYLPLIVKQVASASTPAGRLLFLHALREAIIHCDSAHIETFAETLWEPLLGEDSEGQDDGAGNVKAACIGKLTTSRPTKYLPELHSRLNSATGAKRATIAAAIRYVFIDKDERYDDLLAPIIADFTKLLDDTDLVVRRLAVSSVNAAAQNKPHLVQEQLSSLLPGLLKETVPRKELSREYQMGPWVVKTDDGINNRKTAYETLHTLLRTCLAQVDIGEVLDRVIASLRDVDEVKLLAFMILERLSVVAEAAVVSRLDELAESIEAIVNSVEPKDASGQDIQRREEVQTTMVRVIQPLYQLSSPTNHPAFDKVVKAMMTSDKRLGYAFNIKNGRSGRRW